MLLCERSEESLRFCTNSCSSALPMNFSAVYLQHLVLDPDSNTIHHQCIQFPTTFFCRQFRMESDFLFPFRLSEPSYEECNEKNYFRFRVNEPNVKKDALRSSFKIHVRGKSEIIFYN